MGCDIHIICEVKENGVWKINPVKIFPNPYYRPEEKDKTKEEQREWSLEELALEPSRSRNYDWFAILANVRNGRGFAGIKTGEGFSVIAEPRGVPEDLSEKGMKFFCLPIAASEELEDEEDEDGNYYVSRKKAEEWVNKYGDKIISIDGADYVTNPDYHSNNYLYLEDFDKFDWNQVTMKYGIISLEEYKKYKDTTKSPTQWSGAISGGNIITINTQEADKVLSGKVKILTKEAGFLNKDSVTAAVDDWNIFVNYEWPVLYSEWFEANIKNTVEPMRKLKEQFEDVRVVFSFDN